jgi:hypothetical protein
MDRNQFLQALKTFEQQLSDVVERLDSTRHKLAALLEHETSNQNIKALMTTLHTDTMQLREECQKFVLNNALWMRGDNGN